MSEWCLLPRCGGEQRPVSPIRTTSRIASAIGAPASREDGLRVLDILLPIVGCRKVCCSLNRVCYALSRVQSSRVGWLTPVDLPGGWRGVGLGGGGSDDSDVYIPASPEVICMYRLRLLKKKKQPPSSIPSHTYPSFVHLKIHCRYVKSYYEYPMHWFLAKRRRFLGYCNRSGGNLRR